MFKLANQSDHSKNGGFGDNQLAFYPYFIKDRMISVKNHINRNILVFFSVYLLSAFGYEFIFFIMTLHIYDLSKNALNIGIFTTLTFIPRLFSSLMGGAADKIGKGKCLFFSASAVSVLLFLMSYLQNMNQIYVIWFMASVFLTFIVNVRGSLMAEIVSREHYTSGNAFSLAVLNGAKLLGPLAGGFIIMLYQIKPLIYFTCAIYILAAVIAALLKDTREIKENHTGAKVSFWDNAKKGFQFMFVNKVFGLLAAIAFAWRLCLGLQVSLFIIFIKTHLGGSSEQYGVFITMMGIGSIGGSLMGPLAAKRVNSLRLIIFGLSLHYLSFAALGLCNNYYGALAIIFSSYLVFYMTLVGLHAVRDQITMDDIRSSAYGTVTSILTPPAIFSMLAGGYLANRFGSSIVLFGAGMLAFLSLHILLFLGRNAIVLMNSSQKEHVAKSA